MLTISLIYHEGIEWDTSFAQPTVVGSEWRGMKPATS